MHRDSTNLATELLIEETRWVQRLARQLVRDPDVADDLAQDTLLAALESRAGEPRSRRAWLAAVLRRLLWERLRREDRRVAREESVARGEEATSTAELFERMSLQQQVVEAVTALPEHYRETILRRYFENETPTAIANSTGTPISTVKTRLARAHGLLRERLDDEHGGDGKSWAVAMLALTLPRRPRVSLALKLASGAGVAVGGLGVVAWILAGGGAQEASSRSNAVRLASASAASADVDGLASAPLERGSVREATPTADAPVVDERLPGGWSATRPPVRGLLLDVDDRPVEGLVLRYEPARRAKGMAAGESIGLSASDGAFRLDDIVGQGRVRAWGSGWVTLFSALVRSDVERDSARVVVAPAAPLRGVVRDTWGAPLAQVRVELRLPEGLRESLAPPLADALLERFVVSTAIDGGFEFAAAPQIDGLTLDVTREGREPERTSWAGLPPAHVEVVLGERADGEEWLAGRVVDALGAGVPDARVSDGRRVYRSNDDGMFRFDGEAARRGGGQLRVVALGFGPLLQPLPSEVSGESLQLRLPARAAAITGRVVDRSGNGLGGMRIWLDDATPFVVPRDETPRDEEAGGAPQQAGPREDAQSSWSLLAGMEPPRAVPESVEALLGGSDSKAWPTTTSKADGSFAFCGLFERRYSLRVQDPETLLTISADAAASSASPGAGRTDARIVLERSSLVDLVEGRVVDVDGAPFPGLEVTLACPSYVLRDQGKSVYTNIFQRESARTDPDGRFRIADVPRDGMVLTIEGSDVLPISLGARERDARWPLRSPLRLVAERACGLRVEVDSGDAARAVGVLDAEGRALTIHWKAGIERTHGPQAPLHAGRTPLLMTSSRAAELVFYDGATELRRETLELAPDGVRVVRP